MPTVSVIVPNFNHEKYLPRRLDSILNQTYPDFEVILLDDCSTDNSLEVLKEYARHPKVSHLIANEENSGSPSKQWKKGIDLARGAFIWIAESDDWADENFLDTLVPFLKNDRTCALAYCASLKSDEYGNIGSKDDWASPLDANRWEKNFYNSGLDEIKRFLIYRNTIPNASGVVFRKAFQAESSAVDDMFFCGDWVFWMEVLSKGNIQFVAKPLNYFRKSSKSITNSAYACQKQYQRFKEYLVAIERGFELSGLPVKFSFSKHYWIIMEWVGSYPVFRNNKPAFFHPPFPAALKRWVYFALLDTPRRIFFRKGKRAWQRIHSLIEGRTA